VAPAPATGAGAASRTAAEAAAAAALLGAIPRGGFARASPDPEAPAPAVLDPGEPVQADLLALDPGEPVPADLLAPEEEMVEGKVPIRELSTQDVSILDALDRLGSGIEDPASPIKPAQLAAAILRLLLRKRIITEAELLDELARRG
jgi:hypothetical protein